MIKGPKPAEVFVGWRATVKCFICSFAKQIPLVLLAVLQLVALIASMLYYRYKANRAGVIRLPEDEEHSSAAHGISDGSFAVQGGGGAARQPREIDGEL